MLTSKQERELKELKRRMSIAITKIRNPSQDEFGAGRQGMLFAGIYRQAQVLLIEPTVDGLNPNSLRRGVHKLLKYQDGLMAGLPKTVEFEGIGQSSIACKAGCDHCCAQRVTTVAPFALALAFHLQKTLSAQELHDLIERLRVFCDSNKTMTLRQRVLDRRLCPVNMNALCIGYEFRPPTCREFHSFSVESCIESRNNPEGDAFIPALPASKQYSSLISRAICSGMEALNLKPDELELIPALNIALTVPNAAQRYIDGEPIFAAAHMPEIIRANFDHLKTKGLPLIDTPPAS